MPVGEDTIAAISTPVGEGAVGIVRLSGPQSIDIVQRFFRGRRPLSEAAGHTLNLGDLIDGEGAVFDRALVAVMRAPRTYTGEHMAEIHCHGGKWLVARVYARTIEMGARPAERGEFTRRALLNGKLDLAQAEAVIDLVKATSDRGLQVAAGQLKGRLSEKVQGPREHLAQVLTHIQAVIDYPEEDLVELDKADAIQRLHYAFNEVERLRQTAHAGKIYYEGLRMGIVGKPNVGKSTLMNAFLGEDRSIVTPIAGTTRDVIEAQAMVAGVAFTLFDTAGLRQTGDAIEQMGMARTDDVMASSDVLCHLFDASEPLTNEDEAAFRRALPFANTIPLVIGLSKQDLPSVTSAEDVKQLLQSVVDETKVALSLADVPVVHFSAVTGEGVERLAREAIAAVGGDDDHRSDAVIVTRERHRRALALAGECVARALEVIEMDAPVELVGVDLQLALEALAEVTGENVSEEIVGRIFAEFCVGK